MEKIAQSSANIIKPPPTQALYITDDFSITTPPTVEPSAIPK